MIRRLASRLVGPLMVVVGYLALRALFDHLGADGGLFSPSGQPNLGVAALALLVIALRVIAVAAVPAVVAYRVVVFVFGLRSTRS